MKLLLSLLLVGSLAVNAALVAMYMKRSAAVAKAETEVSAARTETAAAVEARAKAVESEAKAREAAISPKTWEIIKTSDFKDLAERLRAAGFPATLTRAIVAMMVSEKFAARQKEVMAKVQANTLGQGEKYWTSNRGFSLLGMDAKTRAELRALSEERSALMKSVFPQSEMDPEGTLASINKRQYGDLPPEKVERLQRILNDYNELRGEVHSAAQGMMLPEDREKLAFIDKEQQSDLDQLLSPEEHFEYEIRSSNLANQLRSQATGFEFTEAEFRILFAAVRATTASDLSQFMTGDQYRQRQAAQLEAAKNALSPERFSEYQQAIDPQYSQANRLVARLNLPASAAKELVSIQQNAMSEATALRSNRDLTNEQRIAQLSTLSQETTKRISSTLGGDRGLEAYKQNGGQWMQILNNISPFVGPRLLPSGGGGGAQLPAVPIR